MNNINIPFSNDEFASVLAESQTLRDMVISRIRSGNWIVTTEPAPTRDILLGELRAATQHDPKNKIGDVKRLREATRNNDRLLSYFSASEVYQSQVGADRTLGLGAAKAFVENQFSYSY